MMALSDCQFQVRNLVMGPGTPYDIDNTTNPFIMSVRADQTDARAWNHGSWSGAEWGEQRVVPLRIVVRGEGTSGWLTAHQALVAAFAPVGDVTEDVELRFVLGGTEYVLFGRPRMVEPNVENIATGLSGTRAAFVATDPLIYSGTLLATEAIPLPVQAGGLSVPLSLPLLIGGTLLGGSADLTNAGTAPTAISFRIDGPVSEPRVTVQSPGMEPRTLAFHLDIPAGQFLLVDSGARTCFLQGLPQASRRGQVTAEPDWPLNFPGTNTIRFTAAEHTAGTLSVSSRSGWW